MMILSSGFLMRAGGGSSRHRGPEIAPYWAAKGRFTLIVDERGDLVTPGLKLLAILI